MEKSGQEYITVSGAGLASGVVLPSYIVYRCKHLYNTWCQSGPPGSLYGASGSARIGQANFLSGFVKIQFCAVNFFGFSSVTHSAAYVSFETPSVNCKRVKVFGTKL